MISVRDGVTPLNKQNKKLRQNIFAKGLHGTGQDNKKEWPLRDENEQTDWLWESSQTLMQGWERSGGSGKIPWVEQMAQRIWEDQRGWSFRDRVLERSKLHRKGTRGICRRRPFRFSRRVLACARVWGQSKGHQKALDAHTRGQEQCWFPPPRGRNLWTHGRLSVREGLASVPGGN